MDDTEGNIQGLIARIAGLNPQRPRHFALESSVPVSDNLRFPIT